MATRTAGAEKRNDFILELYKLAFRENGPDGNGGKDNLYSSLYSKLSSHFFVFLSAEHLFGFCIFIITGVFRFVNPLFTFFILTRHGSRKRDSSHRFLSFFEKSCRFSAPSPLRPRVSMLLFIGGRGIMKMLIYLLLKLIAFMQKISLFMQLHQF